jgi:hypothetical protein
VYNPVAGLYTNAVDDILPPPADGSQVLFIKGANYLAQFLTNTLAPNQIYTLSGAIGNRGDGNGLVAGDADYVRLLAGSTILAECTNLAQPGPGGFLPWVITYQTGAEGVPSGTLQIQLGQQGSGEVHFDNITLASETVTNVTLTLPEAPVIISQPTNQTVPAGSSPVFTAAADGAEPLEYLWYSTAGNLIQSGTNPVLTLPQVLSANAGSYAVVVTNAYGSVTSAPAALTVTIPLTPPQIMASDASFGFQAGRFGFELLGAFGQTIVVDGSADLVNWTPLHTNIAGDGPFYFFDPPSTNLAWRFYRARLP